MTSSSKNEDKLNLIVKVVLKMTSQKRVSPCNDVIYEQAIAQSNYFGLSIQSKSITDM